ncbi:MAG: amino acid ABC transporter permease [Oscillospiraceae bacterium]
MFATVIGALNEGFLQTLKLFAVTLIGALPLGLVISFGSMSRWTPLSRPGQWMLKKQRRCVKRFAKFLIGFRPVSLVTRLLVWIIRGTPLMLQLIIIYFIPGRIMATSPWGSGESGRFVASAIAFIINYACYFSEIYRGGIQGVPAGQQEAGLVLGMTKGQIFFKVTLMQMIKRIVPPMSNEIITLVKDTSIARIISLQEVIWAGYAFLKGSHGYSGLLWPLFFTGVYYLAFVGILTLLFGWIERKLNYFR